MAGTGGESDELKSDINITPLVDVMLVLLIIFMVVTPLLRQQVPVELPVAQHSRDSQESSAVTLVVTADDTLVLDERPIAAEALDAALRDVYATHPDKTIFLEADRSLPYSRVVDLMDACRAAGVERIGIITKRAPATRG